ncbi:MAG: FAD-dependent oxidoreductase [Vicinamibacterales bacterium]
MSGFRLDRGGLIDRDQVLDFRFDGRRFSGFSGDTLASALLAAGVRVVGRSFKLHRPRGLLAAGVEEPNALMQVGEGACSTPNLRATEVELHEGLTARAVNCWPSARMDVGAILRPVERFLPAGFYYKTFMWPNWSWFERAIRRAAGLGRAAASPDPAQYEHRYAHCDVLVVGGGSAGLQAALDAAARGLRVMLCEQEPRWGGRLLWGACTIDGQRLEGEPARAWVEMALATLRREPEVRLLNRTTAVGYFDHGFVALLERVTDHLGPAAPAGLPRQRLWQVRAGRIVIATGALERPLVFPGNDRPGVMLAGAVQRYLREFGVAAGRRVAIFTNNDSAYECAGTLAACGVDVVAVIDSREHPSSARPSDVSRILTGARVVGTSGSPSLGQVIVADQRGRRHRLDVDVLAMSGGLNPTLHLYTQAGGALSWDRTASQFRPSAVLPELDVAGDASGTDVRIEPLWRVAGHGKAFVDFQNDVSVDDVELAARENYRSVEHLKRYTTLGMAPDQGKTSNVSALAIMSELTGDAPGLLGSVRSRFPYTPVAIGAFAGPARRSLLRPLRRMPLHSLHHSLGASFDEYGGWARPAGYPAPGESALAAEQRESLAVRRSVGLFDASPLGKIEVVGPDAATFLDRVYANTISTLAEGRVRYGLMLSEQGVIIDDGVVARLETDRFLVGTTSGGAARIAAMLEEWLQGEWPDLRVLVAPVTTARSVVTVSGPKARDTMLAAGVDFPIDAKAFPHMSFRSGTVAGTAARVSRVSFTGEVSYEIEVDNADIELLWISLTRAGAPWGIAPIGIDAWSLLRLEKGYLHVGADTDGTTCPDDIGWGHVLKREQDFIGRRSLTRPAISDPTRYQLVGLEPLNGLALPPGTHVRATEKDRGSEGYITSSGYSPTLGRWVALALVQRGRAREGEVVTLVTGNGRGQARITRPGSYDPDGERLRA